VVLVVVVVVVVPPGKGLLDITAIAVVGLTRMMA
jgi:hypothetical protein